ncbi:MAG: MATE family efflux transporter, partial [Alistipes sp.]|nr:MATE family efflux transporter [Alistipes sp.]
ARMGFYIILVMAVVVSAGMLIFRESIGELFTDNEEVVALVAAIVIPFVVYQVGDGLQCNYANALRGISDVKPLTLFAFLAYFVISLPAGYLFGFVFDLGLVGVWLSFPLGLTTAGVLYYLRFRYRTRRLL